MSHTFNAGDTTFIHNPDMSGEVTLLHEDKQIVIPGQALIAFMAEYVRQEKIRLIEGTGDAEALGILPRKS